MKISKNNIRQVSHNSKQHSPAIKHSHAGHQNAQSESKFENFAKNFFDIFTDKDRRESQIYLDMKCLDASKDHQEL